MIGRPNKSAESVYLCHCTNLAAREIQWETKVATYMTSVGPLEKRMSKKTAITMKKGKYRHESTDQLFSIHFIDSDMCYIQDCRLNYFKVNHDFGNDGILELTKIFDNKTIFQVSQKRKDIIASMHFEDPKMLEAGTQFRKFKVSFQCFNSKQPYLSRNLKFCRDQALDWEYFSYAQINDTQFVLRKKGKFLNGGKKPVLNNERVTKECIFTFEPGSHSGYSKVI